MQRGTDPATQAKPIAALAADPDAIVASGLASAATPQTVDGAALNGVIGAGRAVPAQQVTATFSSHVDWDATTAVVTGEDADGNPQTDTIAIPNGGAATASTVKAFSRVTSILIPAQSGTGGTATIGYAPTAPELSRRDFPGIALYDVSREPYDSTTGTYASGDPCPVIEEGDVFVRSESAAAAGDPVYVRVVESGSDLRGQFSAVPGANFARLRGAQYVSNASALGIVVARIGG